MITYIIMYTLEKSYIESESIFFFNVMEMLPKIIYGNTPGYKTSHI